MRWRRPPPPPHCSSRPVAPRHRSLRLRGRRLGPCGPWPRAPPPPAPSGQI
jgi:hypothetical protein